MAADLRSPSKDEMAGRPFANPSVGVLRREIRTIRSRVEGTSEARGILRSMIWGTVLVCNPPSLWITINPSDTQDPIAQVIVGEDINLAEFNNTAGPRAGVHAKNIAEDPYAASEYFHTVINAVLQELLGIKRVPVGAPHRNNGIFGEVRVYVGVVEAQGRGTLHLHLLVWLKDAPTSRVMTEALKIESFRDRIQAFIRQHVRADNGDNPVDLQEMVDADACREQGFAMTTKISTIPEVSYSRPVHPESHNYMERSRADEQGLARSLQVHKCGWEQCWKMTKKGRVCKRRAPFPLSEDAWINENGDWGPRRVFPWLNSWSPSIMQCVRCNQDIKLVTNGVETKDITWYITKYMDKPVPDDEKQSPSVILAATLEIHREHDARIESYQDSNKKLMQRMAHSLNCNRAMGGPQIMMYLMGYGDKFLSHHYSPIYWSGVRIALTRTFPELRETR